HVYARPPCLTVCHPILRSCSYCLAALFCLLYASFFYCYGDHRDLHSFPTRRSSDLWRLYANQAEVLEMAELRLRCQRSIASALRSEEHTSELQSRFDLVCRLLLEKKN